MCILSQPEEKLLNYLVTSDLSKAEETHCPIPWDLDEVVWVGVLDIYSPWTLINNLLVQL